MSEKNHIKKQMGMFYTPNILARHLIQITLDPLLKPIVSSISTEFQAIPFTSTEVQDQPMISQFKKIIKPILNFRLCDPAVGQGIFLIAAFEYLYNFYPTCSSYLQSNLKINSEQKSQIKNSPPITSSYQDLSILCTEEDFTLEFFLSASPLNQLRWGHYVLSQMLYGVDINPESCSLAITNLIEAYKTRTQSLISLLRENEHLIDRISDALNHLENGSLLRMQLSLHIVPGNPLLSPFSSLEPFPSKYHVKYKEILRTLVHLQHTLFKETSEDRARNLLKEIAKKQHIFIQKLNQDLHKSPYFHTIIHQDRDPPFHWFCVFPSIFVDFKGEKVSDPGFSIIVCNPPWKVHQMNEIDFFSSYDSTFGTLSPSARKKKRKELLEDPNVQTAYDDTALRFECINALFGELYPLQQERKFNLYKLFLERFFPLLTYNGRAGWIVPLGLFGEARGGLLREYLFSHTNVTNIFRFFSDEMLFKGISEGQPFVLFTFSNGFRTRQLSYYPHALSDLSRFNELEGILKAEIDFLSITNQNFPSDCGPPIFSSIPPSNLSSFSPISLTLTQIKNFSPSLLVAGHQINLFSIPLFSSLPEIKMMEYLIQFPKLRSGWKLQGKRELNRTDDERNGIISHQPTSIPVIEGKHLVHYGFSAQEVRFYVTSPHEYGEYRPISKESRIVWRNVSNIRLRRRMFCALLPAGYASVNSLNYICSLHPSPESLVKMDEDEKIFLLGLLGSLVAEYQLRLFSTNNNLNQYLIENLAIPRFNPQNYLHQQFLLQMKSFLPHAEKWADKMVTLGRKYREKEELMTQCWTELAQIDRFALEIFTIPATLWVVIFDKFPKINPAYFTLIREAVIDSRI